MISRYLMKREYEPGTGLGKYGERILELIKMKSQDTTFRALGSNQQGGISKLRLRKEERKDVPEPLDNQ